MLDMPSSANDEGNVPFYPYSNLASFCQVSMTESGFSDIDSMPCPINHAAKSGLSYGQLVEA